MSQVMRDIMTGQCTEAQIGAFMMGMRMKSESIDEIVGAVSVMRELEPGLFSACVCNGLGTARSTLTGIAAADLAMAQTSSANG